MQRRHDKTEEDMEQEIKTELDVALPTSPAQNERAKKNHEAEDAEEGSHRIDPVALEWDPNVHTKHTAHQIKRHQNRRQEGNLAEDAVGVRTLRDAVDGEGGEVIAVRTGEQLLTMTQVVCHGHDVILDITKIHANIHVRRDLIVFVASLGEAAKDVGFTAEQAQQCHTILANAAD